MRFAVLSLVLLLASTPAARAEVAPAWEGCLTSAILAGFSADPDLFFSADPDLRIRECTAMIDSGESAGPLLAFAYTIRGFTWFELGEYARVIEDMDQAIHLYEALDQAIRLDSEHTSGQAGLAGRFLLAITDGYSSSYTIRGFAWFELGEYAYAMEDLDEAIHFNPEFADAYNLRGFVYRELGEYDRAARDWEREIGVGGASVIRGWQNRLKDAGHYAGAVDGFYDDKTWAALLACARDPLCLP